MLPYSLAILAEFGDHDIVEHGVSYLDDYQLGPEEVRRFHYRTWKFLE